MSPNSRCRPAMFKNYLLILSLFLFATNTFSQKTVADSLQQSLTVETTDTGKVFKMWNLANAMNKYNPDSALIISQEALYLAQKIRDGEGESRSLGILANTFLKIGNYTRALELYIQ